MASLSQSRETMRHSDDPIEFLIWPETVDTFIQRRWTKEFAIYPGQPCRFDDLFSWKLLNQVLCEHSFRVPRIRLFKDGRALDPSIYMEMSLAREPKLKSSGVQAAMDDGATLILDHVQELSRPLRDLTLKLERKFRAIVNVNLYASIKSTKGFSLHWDDHEAFAVQVGGKKHWTVYPPSRAYPTTEEKGSFSPPTGEPTWVGLLTEGQVLYLPRGWWHLVCSVDQPSLHLTIGIANPLGIDLLRWAVERLKQYEIVRRDLPLNATDDEKIMFVDELIALLRDCLPGDAVDSFMAINDARAAGPTAFNLPGNAFGDYPSTSRLRLFAPRSIQRITEGTNGASELQLCGRRWTLDKAVVPGLQILNDGGEHTLAELKAACPQDEAHEALLRAIDLLGKDGIIEIVAY